MRLASFNIENLFSRPIVMNRADWDAGRADLDLADEFHTIIAKSTYTDADKARLAALLQQLGLARRDEGKLFWLRKNRGSFVKRPRAGGVEIVANGRGDWIGWLELKREAIQEVATVNTARVINTVGADVLAVIEAEDRVALNRFNSQVLKTVGRPYDHVMLIDGNDDRGIDVGVMTRTPYIIELMRSHVDDPNPTGGGTVFSRDCPEYEIMLPSGARLWLLVNHFKSKGFGVPARSDARRKAQAIRTAEIYTALRNSGQELVAVVGDLNDTPDSDPLSPLLSNTDLADISNHSRFDSGGWPGTYKTCGESNKIDYILLSPKLQEAVVAAGIERSGLWTASGRWSMMPELREPDAASDHAALWVDLAI